MWGDTSGAGADGAPFCTPRFYASVCDGCDDTPPLNTTKVKRDYLLPSHINWGSFRVGCDATTQLHRTYNTGSNSSTPRLCCPASRTHSGWGVRIKVCLTVRGGQQYPGFIMDAAVREYVWRFMGLGGTCSRCGSDCALTGRCRTEDHMLLCLQLTCRVGSPGRTVTHTKCRSSPAMTNYTLAAHLSSQTSCRQSVRAREGWMLRMSILGQMCARISQGYPLLPEDESVWRSLRHSSFSWLKIEAIQRGSVRIVSRRRQGGKLV